MAHKIPRCIEWVTSIHALEPGDILATGTNHRGLSGFQDGDVIELETEGLGRLRFNVRDDLKRTWAPRDAARAPAEGSGGHDAAAHRQAHAGAPLELHQVEERPGVHRGAPNGIAVHVSEITCVRPPAGASTPLGAAHACKSSARSPA